jgi:hypothetical protein
MVLNLRNLPVSGWERKCGDRYLLRSCLWHDRAYRHRFLASFVMVQFSATAYSPDWFSGLLETRRLCCVLACQSAFVATA